MGDERPAGRWRRVDRHTGAGKLDLQRCAAFDPVVPEVLHLELAAVGLCGGEPFGRGAQIEIEPVCGQAFIELCESAIVECVACAPKATIRRELGAAGVGRGQDRFDDLCQKRLEPGRHHAAKRRRHGRFEQAFHRHRAQVAMHRIEPGHEAGRRRGAMTDMELLSRRAEVRMDLEKLELARIALRERRLDEEIVECGAPVRAFARHQETAAAG